MKDTFDIEGLLKTLFSVFFFNNWMLLAVALVILFWMPMLLLAYAMVRGIALLYSGSFFAVGALGIVIAIALLAIPAMQYFSRIQEGDIVAHVEAVTAQNRFRVSQVHQLNQSIGREADRYSAFGRIDQGSLRAAVEQQIVLLDEILEDSLRQYRYRQITKVELHQRFHQAMDENKAICMEMQDVLGSAEEILKVL